jgi:hypothetical protein
MADNVWRTKLARTVHFRNDRRDFRREMPAFRRAAGRRVLD